MINEIAQQYAETAKRVEELAEMCRRTILDNTCTEVERLVELDRLHDRLSDRCKDLEQIIEVVPA